MAPHYDQIGEYGLNELVAKRLTTPGGSVAPTVAPELFPTMTLESDRPEWGHLKGEQLFARYIVRGAVAAQYSIAMLYLPSTARTIATVTSVSSITSNGFNMARLIGIGGGLGGFSAQATQGRDFRNNANGSSCFVETTTNVALPARFAEFFSFQQIYSEYWEPIIITPGTALGIYTQNVNQDLRFAISWRERGAQPGELI